MKCSTIFLLVLGVISLSSADRKSDEESVKKAGFVQFLLLDYLASMARHSSVDREMINVEQKKALDCLAEIKSNNSFCYTFTNHFERCSKPLLEKVETYVEPRAKELPTAAVSAIVSQAEYLCNTDGEHILEILNPCVFKSILSDQRACFKKIQQEVSELEDNSVAFPKVCRAACNLKDCFTGKFKEECKNEITLETVKNLYTSSMKPCRDKLDDKPACLDV